MNTALPNKGLYAITPNIANTTVLLHKVEQALKGGIALLQYRDKISNENERLSKAIAIHELCLQYKTPLIINDSPKLALACNAEGVHLGQGDASIREARELLGDNAIIGTTCHHHQNLAVEAEKQKADYLALGRFFPSSSKPGEALATTEILADIQCKTHIPIVAIGGITRNNAQAIINAGADYVAVIDDIFSQEDITGTCQEYLTLFSRTVSQNSKI